MKFEFNEVQARIGTVKIVHGVSLRINAGEMAGIIGPNGSGKSTLLRTAYRHLRPHAGIVQIGDEDAWQLPSKAAALRVAAVPQERSSEFDFTVNEMVEMGRIPHMSLFGSQSVVSQCVVRAAMERVGASGSCVHPAMFVQLATSRAPTGARLHTVRALMNEYGSTVGSLQ